MGGVTLEREEAPQLESRGAVKLRLVIAAQIGIPAVLLAWRLVTGDLPFGGWAWGMYT